MKASDYGIVQSEPYHVKSDFYESPDDEELWLPCPFCGLKPKVWDFDNGRHTSCGCRLIPNDDYLNFSIRAESVMSIWKRNSGDLTEYDPHELRKNWNHWCETGEILFSRNKTPERW